MGTFNERAEHLMDELTKLADSKREAKMLQLVNRVTLDVITKVLHPNVCPPCDSWWINVNEEFTGYFIFLVYSMVNLTCSTAHRSHSQEIVFLQKTKISKHFTDVLLLTFRWPLEGIWTSWTMNHLSLEPLTCVWKAWFIATQDMFFEVSSRESGILRISIISSLTCIAFMSNREFKECVIKDS